MVMNANFSISSGEHEIRSAPSSQRHSNQASNGLPGHSRHYFPKSCNSAGVYGIYVVNSITVGPPACTHLDPGVVYVLHFGILWAVLYGWTSSRMFSSTSKDDSEGGLLWSSILVVAPLYPKHLPFSGASVPLQPLLTF